MERLFSYGTLRDPKVQEKVFGRILEGKSNVLLGYELSNILIDGKKYPMAVPKSGGRIRGIVYELKSEELKHADGYEEKYYKRVKIKLGNNSKAWVYVDILYHTQTSPKSDFGESSNMF